MDDVEGGFAILRYDVVEVHKYWSNRAVRYLDATAGDTGGLFLLDSGIVGFIEKDKIPWFSPLDEISAVEDARGYGSFARSVGVKRKLLRATFGDTRRTVLFRGIAPDRGEFTTLDKVLGKAPHGFGLIYLGARFGYQQRGSNARSKEACSWWKRLLRGEIDIEEYAKDVECEGDN